MRSEIRNCLFSAIRPKGKSCDICGGSFCHPQSDANGSDLPSYYGMLVRPDELLIPLYSEEELLLCPGCGSYFAYCEWSPGSSDDAMKTCQHRSLTGICSIEAEIILYESERNIESLYRQSPEVWGKAYDQHQRGLKKAGETLRGHAKKIFKEGVRFIQLRPAQKLNTYREEAIDAELEVFDILSGYLMSYFDLLTFDEILVYLSMMSDDREKVRRAISSGIILGSYKISENTELLIKLDAAVRNLPGSIERLRMERRFFDALNPDIPWNSFYNTECSVAAEHLRDHLEMLPGLILVCFNPGCTTESSIEFDYRGFYFITDYADSSWEFFVKGECPDVILDEIRMHLSKL